MEKFKIPKKITEEEMNLLARLEFGLKAAENVMNAVANAKPLNEMLYDKKSEKYSEIFVEYNINMNKLGHKYFEKEMVKYPIYTLYFNIASSEFVLVPDPVYTTEMSIS